MTASCLYIGEVTHHRLRPVDHRLRYRLFQIFLDLDEAPALSARSRLFGFNRGRLLSFHECDHGDGSDVPLKAQIEARVRDAGFPTGGPVRVLCLPRVLGYVFNPLTLYFCGDGEGGLSAIVYEVNNTFGGRTFYVLPASQAARIEHGARKAMHVSPFLDMDLDYAFSIGHPAERLGISIRVMRADEVVLAAAFAGARRSFHDRELLAAWLRHPMLTAKVIAAIHWEALKLWRKGLKFHPNPHAVPRSSNKPATSSHPSRSAGSASR